MGFFRSIYFVNIFSASTRKSRTGVLKYRVDCRSESPAVRKVELYYSPDGKLLSQKRMIEFAVFPHISV